MTVIGISVMIGIGNFYSDVATTYGIQNTSTSYSTFLQFNNSMSQMSTGVAQIQTATTGKAKNIPDIIYDVTSFFIGVGTILVSIPTVMGSFINTMILVMSYNAIAVPSWVGTMISIIIIIAVVMQIVRLFMKAYFEI
jgi:hypothetical protein